MTAATATRTVALAVTLAAGACSASDDPAAGAVETEAPPPTEFSPQPPAVSPSPGEEADGARFQRLSVEALRLMIAAAQAELPIGPIQERITAARSEATTDIAAAADALEGAVADLQAMLAASRD